MYFEFDPEERLGSAWSPIIDVFERADAVFVRVELPGVAREDIRLRWRKGVLTITGSKQRQIPEQDSCRFLCVEREFGRFRRDIAINVAIDYQGSSAELRNGLLSIRLPKIVERAEDSMIPIE